MSKVSTFSRTFPSYHPKKGQPTYFVERILNELNIAYRNDDYLQDLLVLNTKNIANGKLTFEDLEAFYLSLKETITTDKLHTIRGNEPSKFKGNRFKVGDKISPRVWFGKPYNSPQIIFCNDIEVKKTFDFEIVNGKYGIGDMLYNDIEITKVANNDGLILLDFINWFPKSFKGQIICWSDKVDY